MVNRDKTFAQKKCGIRYEDCVWKYGCKDGEECWFDSENYFYDCGPGATYNISTKKES